MNSAQRVTAKICMTRDVGTHGNLYGGNMLAWMDEAGAIFARCYTGVNHVVTVRFAEVVFKVPVKVGEIVEFFAVNPRTGRTSITFDIEGRVKNRLVVKTTCTFVALDEEGRPMTIPPADHEI